MAANPKLRQTEPFGAIAIRKGFITPAQLEEALEIQKRMDEKGEKHKLIGIILLEMGALSTSELIEVLQEMDKQRKSERR